MVGRGEAGGLEGVSLLGLPFGGDLGEVTFGDLAPGDFALPVPGGLLRMLEVKLAWDSSRVGEPCLRQERAPRVGQRRVEPPSEIRRGEVGREAPAGRGQRERRGGGLSSLDGKPPMGPRLASASFLRRIASAPSRTVTSRLSEPGRGRAEAPSGVPSSPSGQGVRPERASSSLCVAMESLPRPGCGTAQGVGQMNSR